MRNKNFRSSQYANQIGKRKFNENNMFVQTEWFNEVYATGEIPDDILEYY